MTTLTQRDALLPEHCPHKLPASCRLTARPICCACQDTRPHANAYRKYIDGVGYVMLGTRQDGYCWPCRTFWDTRIEAARMETEQARIPFYPDQTDFVNTWHDWHRGYRIVTLEDGTEERENLRGQPLHDVSIGKLPVPAHGGSPYDARAIKWIVVPEIPTDLLWPPTEREVIPIPDEDRLFDSDEDGNSDSDQAVSRQISTNPNSTNDIDDPATDAMSTEEASDSNVIDHNLSLARNLTIILQRLNSLSALIASTAIRFQHLLNFPEFDTSEGDDLREIIEDLRNMAEETAQRTRGLTFNQRLRRSLRLTTSGDSSPQSPIALNEDINPSIDPSSSNQLDNVEQQSSPSRTNHVHTTVQQPHPSRTTWVDGQARRSVIPRRTNLNPSTTQPYIPRGGSELDTIMQQSRRSRGIRPNTTRQQSSTSETNQSNTTAQQVIDPGPSTQPSPISIREQRNAVVAERMATVFGTREEVQQADYESPITLMFNRQQDWSDRMQRRSRQREEELERILTALRRNLIERMRMPVPPRQSLSELRSSLDNIQGDLFITNPSASAAATSSNTLVDGTEANDPTSIPNTALPRLSDADMEFYLTPIRPLILSTLREYFPFPFEGLSQQAYEAHLYTIVIHYLYSMGELIRGHFSRPASSTIDFTSGIILSLIQQLIECIYPREPGEPLRYYVYRIGAERAGRDTPTSLLHIRRGGDLEGNRAPLANDDTNPARQELAQMTPPFTRQATIPPAQPTRQGLEPPARPLEPSETMIQLQCIVCQEQIADIALVPCGHMVMCRWCSERHATSRDGEHGRHLGTKCPMCRTKISKRVRIWGLEGREKEDGTM